MIGKELLGEENRNHSRPATRRIGLTVALGIAVCAPVSRASVLQKRYYAYPAVEDRNGVIAPWYKGQNGQCDFRVRIAAETLKRYPWVTPPKAVSPAPHYVFNGHWKIDPNGTITIPDLNPWDNGDLGQRAAYVLSGFVDYYRYTGDPAAIAHITVQADALLDHCQTPSDHPWPNFLISVPIHGKVYGKCDPRGMMQLDIVAEVGLGMLRAYQLTGNTRWFDACKHWGDLLAAKRNRTPGMCPWNRYANPEMIKWEDHMTGGVAFILVFFDELIRLGYTGKDNEIVRARDDGRAYLRDVLLPNWTVNDVWGRNYWDWPDPVQAENVTEFVARYLIENPRAFPNWRCDARNILNLFINHTSVANASKGDVFHGAWAYPESNSCCGRSLWYGPMELAPVYAQYGVATGSEWALEMARRQMILSTYDPHETGVSEDNIDGGQIVAGDWFKITHPMPLKHCLNAIAWQPEILGANRENHIVRSSAVVNKVIYDKGRIAYATFDAPAPTLEVLRLAFCPKTITADDTALRQVGDLNTNGYKVKDLPGGDWIVTIRHDGAKHIVVEGDDPQETAEADRLTFEPSWDQETIQVESPLGIGRRFVARASSQAGAAVSFRFTGNQVRVIGSARPDGGWADVYVDGVKQLVGIDCWCPQERDRQVLYYKNGLANDEHTLKVVVRGEKNPLSKGTNVYIGGAQWSAATGDSGFGEGGGPTDAQRVIFGYPERTDYVDSKGNAWQPALEWIVRLGDGADSVTGAWTTKRRRIHIANTPDPELYRYGVGANDFTAYFTVGQGTYHARLMFCETRDVKPEQRAITSVAINGRRVVDKMDVTETAGGVNKAVDLIFNDIQPSHGVITIRFTGHNGQHAMVSAVEIAPGDGGQGAKPVRFKEPAPPPQASRPASADANLLVNPGFEEGAVGDLGALGKTGGGHGWKYVFAGAGRSYVWAESAYSIHPDWGLPVIRSGKEALRTHTDGAGHTIVYQDVAASPETAYTASVWVRADDLRGKGFGQDACDSAGLRIQELDAQGKVVVDHPKQAVVKKCDYQRLSLKFTTAKTTVRLRFMLDTVIAGPYDQGHVTYDDCSLLHDSR